MEFSHKEYNRSIVIPRSGQRPIPKELFRYECDMPFFKEELVEFCNEISNFPFKNTLNESQTAKPNSEGIATNSRVYHAMMRLISSKSWYELECSFAARKLFEVEVNMHEYLCSSLTKR